MRDFGFYGRLSNLVSVHTSERSRDHFLGKRDSYWSVERGCVILLRIIANNMAGNLKFEENVVESEKAVRILYG